MQGTLRRTLCQRADGGMDSRKKLKRGENLLKVDAQQWHCAKAKDCATGIKCRRSRGRLQLPRLVKEVRRHHFPGKDLV
jgi:hypothetical protein